MTVWTSVLWKINIHMAKKWTESVLQQSFISIFHFRSEYTTVAVLMNLIFRENVMVKQHVIKEWPAGKSSRISPRNSIHASRITSGLKETSAECRQASFRRSCLDKGCHSKGDWLIVAIVARELSSSKNRKKKLGTSKIKRNAYNECKDRFHSTHKTPMEHQLNLKKGTKICQFILLQ